MDYIAAKQQAVKYIGLTKKTEQEIRMKLEKIQVEDDVIEQVVEELISIGYIDDVAYANLYIKQCLKEMKKSKVEIAKKLLQKGIKDCIIEDSLDNVPHDYEEELRERIIKQKSKSLDEERINIYLHRRGLIDYKEWD